MASEGPHKVPLQLLLEGGALQWLLGQDAAASLVVLEARRDLPAETVLQLLQGELCTVRCSRLGSGQSHALWAIPGWKEEGGCCRRFGLVWAGAHFRLGTLVLCVQGTLAGSSK